MAAGGYEPVHPLPSVARAVQRQLAVGAVRACAGDAVRGPAGCDRILVGPGKRHRSPDRAAPRRSGRAELSLSVYYEAEGQGDPTVGQLTGDLTYLRDRYGSDPRFLRIDGRFVVFVYAEGHDGCAMADRWKRANTVGAYVVLKVFSGYRGCASQPDGWHQYGPAKDVSDHTPFAYSVSPGFWKASESTPRLARDPERWRVALRAMIASNARFQLVTTFNEWGEGTSVESATEWASPSGMGDYLDALHDILGGARR